MKVDILRFVEKTNGTTAKYLAEGMKVTQHTSCMALLRATRQRLLTREKNYDGEYHYKITQKGRDRRVYFEQNLP